MLKPYCIAAICPHGRSYCLARKIIFVYCSNAHCFEDSWCFRFPSVCYAYQKYNHKHRSPDSPLLSKLLLRIKKLTNEFQLLSINFLVSTKKSPALAVQIFLIPGFNQVGAMSKSLGFPVLSGHAHPFRMIAPVLIESRGTRFICHAQSRGNFFFLLRYLYQN